MDGNRERSFDRFLNDLKKKHPSIKFNYKVLQNPIAFLNTEIYLQNENLDTKIYRKETDR